MDHDDVSMDERSNENVYTKTTTPSTESLFEERRFARSERANSFTHFATVKERSHWSFCPLGKCARNPSKRALRVGK